jgi:hypothetical protein
MKYPTEPLPTLYARSSAASLALGSSTASSRSWTLIRSPGRSPTCESTLADV